MNKHKILFIIIVLLISIGTISITAGCFYSADLDNQLFRFDSAKAALIDGINQNSSDTTRTKDPLGNVVLSTEQNGSLYVVARVPYSEYGMAKDCVYIAAIRNGNNKFCFEKLSPDLSLNAAGDPKDADYTPSATFYFDNMDGLYFAVGKIYDENYKPYFRGKQIRLLNENIYAVVQKNERPQIDVVKIEMKK